jgi:hypothetical protein
MVGDFVVVGPIDIDDRRRAPDLIGHERQTEIAQQSRCHGALERENQTPAHPRFHVMALLPPTFVELRDDLAPCDDD